MKRHILMMSAALVLVLAATAHAERALVTANRANVRARPRADSPIIWTLDQGAEVEVLEKSGDWWKIQVSPEGSSGWVKSSFLKVLPSRPAVEPVTPEATTEVPLPPEAPEAPPPAPPARAPRRTAIDTRPKIKFDLDGAFGATSFDFRETRPLREFAEDGIINTSYKAKTAPGFEVGLQYRFYRGLGLGAAISRVNRDEEGSFEAELPHPLFFNRDRRVSGDLTGFSYKETAVHVDLVYVGTSGSLDFNLFAGPSFIKVESDLLDQLQYSQAYPYDTVTVTGTPARAFTDNPVGFNAGMSLDYRFGQRLGLGAKVRFSRAKASLQPASGQKVDLDAGGLQVGLGARVFF